MMFMKSVITVSDWYQVSTNTQRPSNGIRTEKVKLALPLIILVNITDKQAAEVIAVSFSVGVMTFFTPALNGVESTLETVCLILISNLNDVHFRALFWVFILNLNLRKICYCPLNCSFKLTHCVFKLEAFPKRTCYKWIQKIKYKSMEFKM